MFEDEQKRANLNGDYLIVAGRGNGRGLLHEFTERAFLIDNLINFMKRYPDLSPHQITIYELREVNECLKIN